MATSAKDQLSFDLKLRGKFDRAIYFVETINEFIQQVRVAMAHQQPSYEPDKFELSKDDVIRLLKYWLFREKAVIAFIARSVRQEDSVKCQIVFHSFEEGPHRLPTVYRAVGFTTGGNLDEELTQQLHLALRKANVAVPG